MRAPWVLFGIVLVSLVTLTSQVAGQVVRGEVVDGETGARIEGAFLQLLDSAGNAVNGVLSDGEGHFLMGAPAEGRYTLMARRIGYADAVSDTLRLASGQTLVYRFAVPVKAISLEGISVTGSPRCETRREAGEATSRLWEAARRALGVLAWSGERDIPFQTVLWDSNRDLSSLDLERGYLTVASAVGRSGFHSDSAEDLAVHGFIRDEGARGIRYMGVDARTLLSETFLDSHCFTVEAPHEGEDDLIGLGFRPVRQTLAPDIEGTLWLDRHTSAPRYLEFSYTGQLVSLDLPYGYFGGRVDFRRLPSGAWVVGRWRLRMPEWRPNDPKLRVRHFRDPLLAVLGSAKYRARSKGLVVHEQGGQMTFMARPYPDRRRGTATLEGVVIDSVNEVPLKDATVFLADGAEFTETDAEGRFRFDSLPAGPNRVGFFHALTDALQVPVTTRPVVLPKGRKVRIELALPPEAGCHLGRNRSVLVGYVLDEADGHPLAGVRVEAKWEGYRGKVKQETTTDAQGRYRFCDTSRGEGRVQPDGGVSVPIPEATQTIIHQDLLAEDKGS